MRLDGRERNVGRRQDAPDLSTDPRERLEGPLLSGSPGTRPEKVGPVNYIRVSTHFYNREEEVDRLAIVLGEVIRKSHRPG